MTSATLILFITASAALIVSPGPTMLLALSNGATYGMRIAMFGFIGAALGNFVLIGIVAVGAGALLRISEQVFLLIKWCGVAYLLWLALVLWRSKPMGLERQAAHVSATASRKAAFSRCLAVALTNPKGILFFAAFLPQFVALDAPQWPQYALLAVIFNAMDVGCMAGYAFGGRQLARLISARSLQGLNRVCAAMLVLLAGFLAAYKRVNG